MGQKEMISTKRYALNSNIAGDKKHIKYLLLTHNS